MQPRFVPLKITRISVEAKNNHVAQMSRKEFL